MVYHSAPVALVTGANRGLGRETACRLARRGFAVMVGSRDLAAGERVVDDIRRAGGTARTVALDVTDAAARDAALAQVAAHFGRLDALVNNAGRIIEAGALDTTEDILGAVFATNVYGAAEMIRAAVPLLKRSSAPRIVNVSSTTGSLALTASGRDFGGNAGGRLAYSTSKAALNMLTLQYAQTFARDPELRHIRINAVTPGFTATDMNHGRGTRTVEEGARVIVELATTTDDVSGRFVNDAGDVPW